MTALAGHAGDDSVADAIGRLVVVDVALVVALVEILDIPLWDAFHVTRALAVPLLLALGGALSLWYARLPNVDDRPSRLIVALGGGVLGAVLTCAAFAFLRGLLLLLLMLMFSGSTGSGGG